MSKKLGPGITADRNGYRAFVNVTLGGGVTQLRSKRFDKDTKKSVMVAWREDQRTDARTHPARATPTRGTLAADVERYLALVAAMPTLDWRRRDLASWVDVFGDLDRRVITSAMIRAQLQTWRTVGPVTIYNPRTGERRTKVDDNGKPVGLSASACSHRRTALLHLWTVLDGKSAPNPVREVPTFAEPPPAPRARNLAALDAAIRTLKSPKQRARGLVLLWTGIRGNSELGKMTAEHVDLEHAVCYVPNGKGGKVFRTVPLTADGLAAWREFAAVDAWGTYDKNALRKSIARACDKAGMSGVRAYDLRHSIATAYLRSGADLADVQALLGHTTPRMTRRYAPFSPEKLRAVGARLVGSIGTLDAAPARDRADLLPSNVTHAPEVVVK